MRQEGMKRLECGFPYLKKHKQGFCMSIENIQPCVIFAADRESARICPYLREKKEE